MRELTIEQKAKAYDEALERAKGVIEQNPLMEYLKKGIEYILPELKESEDEKIKKALIEHFAGAHSSMYPYKGFTKEQILAWLEKQGEQKHTAEEVLIKAGLKPYKDGDQWCVLLGNNIQEGICGFGDTIDDALYAFLNDLIKSHKEQKPAMIQWKGNNLKEVVDFTGVYKEGFEKWFHNSWEEYEKYVHEHNNIFKIFNEDGSHMEVPVGAWIIKAPDGHNTASRFAISPILTEISIESNFKFKKAIECIENYVNSFPHSQRPEIWQHINFLKSFKGIVQPQRKQEWSEEDEQYLLICKNALAKYQVSDKWDATIISRWLENKLKSLRHKSTWKPSDEQMYHLSEAAHHKTPFWDCGILIGLYDELKKLKEG